MEGLRHHHRIPRRYSSRYRFHPWSLKHRNHQQPLPRQYLVEPLPRDPQDLSEPHHPLNPPNSRSRRNPCISQTDRHKHPKFETTHTLPHPLPLLGQTTHHNHHPRHPSRQPRKHPNVLPLPNLPRRRDHHPQNGLQIPLDRLPLHHPRLQLRLGIRGRENGRLLPPQSVHYLSRWCGRW